MPQHTASVESATPLSPDLQAIVKAESGRSLRGGVDHSICIENPELIGGMRIQVGSDVYDGSVRAGLKALARELLNEGDHGKPIEGN